MIILFCNVFQIYHTQAKIFSLCTHFHFRYHKHFENGVWKGQNITHAYFNSNLVQF